MKIGLTYDLRSDYLKQGYSLEETAEFDKESTIEGIEQAIAKAGFKTERIGHVKNLMKALLENKKWDLVFNIAEGLYGEGRESLVPALLDAHKIPYVFSGPVTLGIALNKAFAKQVVRDSRVNTPAFHVVSQLSDINAIRLEYPLFAKPISEGTGKGIDAASVIHSRNEFSSLPAYSGRSGLSWCWLSYSATFSGPYTACSVKNFRNRCRPCSPACSLSRLSLSPWCSLFLHYQTRRSTCIRGAGTAG